MSGQCQIIFKIMSGRCPTTECYLSFLSSQCLYTFVCMHIMYAVGCVYTGVETKSMCNIQERLGVHSDQLLHGYLWVPVTRQDDYITSSLMLLHNMLTAGPGFPVCPRAPRGPSAPGAPCSPGTPGPPRSPLLP